MGGTVKCHLFPPHPFFKGKALGTRLDLALMATISFPESALLCPAERATGTSGIIRFNSSFHWLTIWAWAVEQESKGKYKWRERQHPTGCQVVIKHGKSNILLLNANRQSLERKGSLLILPKRKRYRLQQQGTQDNALAQSNPFAETNIYMQRSPR